MESRCLSASTANFTSRETHLQYMSFLYYRISMTVPEWETAASQPKKTNVSGNKTGNQHNSYWPYIRTITSTNHWYEQCVLERKSWTVLPWFFLILMFACTGIQLTICFWPWLPLLALWILICPYWIPGQFKNIWDLDPDTGKDCQLIVIRSWQGLSPIFCPQVPAFIPLLPQQYCWLHKLQ